MKRLGAVLLMLAIVSAWFGTGRAALAKGVNAQPTVLYHRGFDYHTRGSRSAVQSFSADSASESNSANSPSQISMHVNVGWNGSFRGAGAWVPVRIAIHNGGIDPFQGSIQIPDSTPVSAVQERRSALARYSARLVLPPGSTKMVTIYLPGADVQSEVDAEVHEGNRVVTSARAFPTKYDDTDVTVGALAGDPVAVGWLRGLPFSGARPIVLPLTMATVDPFAEVLANFDVIVVSTMDTSRLAFTQRQALEGYVRNGGAIVEVGGPDWQETFRGLPVALLPGTPVGTRPLPDLGGLGTVGFGAPPPASTTVSILSHPRGALLAQERGVPLVVRASLGYGTVTYLAFDPQLAPIFGWNSASGFLSRVVFGGAVQATRRLSTVPGTDQPSILQPAPGLMDLSSALAGTTNGALPPLALTAVLLIIYVLFGVLGLAAFRRRRWSRRRWVAVPLFSTVVYISAQALPGNGPQNVVPVLAAFNGGNAGAAAFSTAVYVGTNAAMGSRAITVDTPSLPSLLMPETSTSTSTNAGAVVWKFQEGASTGVQMSRGVTTLRTTNELHGRVVTHIRVDALGRVSGTITNRTDVTLWRPALKAGDASMRLHDLAPGQTASVSLQPYVSMGHQEERSTLFGIYGQPSLQAKTAGIASDSSVDARIRDAVGAIPGGDALVREHEITFVAWIIDASLGLHASGAVVRSVSMLSLPVTVDLPNGNFTVPTGTVGAALVDQIPARPVYACCTSEPQAVYVGSGGSATFDIDFPGRAGVTLSKLTLHIYAGGSDPSYTGYTDVPRGSAAAFDWTSQRWIRLTFAHGRTVLSEPNRFVSSTGTILIRLTSSNKLSELTISDPNRDIQVSATGIRRSSGQG